MKTYIFAITIWVVLAISTVASANPLVEARSKDYCAAGPLTEAEINGLKAQAQDRLGVQAVDRAAGAPQRYGTQPEAECNDDGTLSPQLLEDPEQVDKRRAALGMEPMAEAMSEMASRRCRPSR